VKVYGFKNQKGDFAWQSVTTQAVATKSKPIHIYTGCPIFFAPLEKGLADPQSLTYPAFANLVLCPEKWIDNWVQPSKDPESVNVLVGATPVCLFDTDEVLRG